MAKKKYNPFRMWLVWVTLILGILFDGFLIYWASTCGGDMCGLVLLAMAILPIYLLYLIKISILGTISGTTGGVIFILLAFIQLLILFLLSWGIQSLIRRLR